MGLGLVVCEPLDKTSPGKPVLPPFVYSNTQSEARTKGREGRRGVLALLSERQGHQEPLLAVLPLCTQIY